MSDQPPIDPPVRGAGPRHALPGDGDLGQLLFDTMLQGIVFQDAAGRILSMNPAAVRILGWSPADFVGRTSVAVERDTIREDGTSFPGLEHPAMLALRTGLEQHGVVMGVFHARERDYRWISISAVPLFRPGETTPHQVYTLFDDITAARRAELALRASEARQRALLASISEPVLVVEAVRDTAGQVVSWVYRDCSDAALAALATTREAFLGRTAGELLPEVAAVMTPYWHAVLETGRPVRYELDSAQGSFVVAVSRAGPGTVVSVATDITRRKQAEEIARLREREGALSESEARFRALIEHSTDMLYVLDAERRFRFWSASSGTVLGWSEDEILGHTGNELVHPDEAAEVTGVFAALLERPGVPIRVTFRARHRDGTYRWIESIGCNLLHEPAVRGVVINARDVTEQRRLRQQIEEAQKLEGIGQLAGGIAHDFNNLLTAILGGAELMGIHVERGEPVRPSELATVRAAAERARDLTRQLLAFARRQSIRPVPLALDEFVSNEAELLRQLLPAEVRLETRGGAGDARVRFDPSQLGQVLLNLALNARDAMPSGGRIEFVTSPVGEDDANAPAIVATRPAGYLRLSVHDTGEGISPEVKAHLFEPFFTTKPPERGTGLGLATVYGIVRQNGAQITVESEPGHGSVFHVYLARTHDPVEPSMPAPGGEGGGRERVLVVDDEPVVRRLLAQTLTGAGYTVDEAGGAEEALALAAASEPFDLLFTDLRMPGLGGRELADAMRQRWPGIRVLYMSGFAPTVPGAPDTLDPRTELLEKPFSMSMAVERVRAILDTPRPAGERD